MESAGERPRIASWSEADAALAELGRAEEELEAIEKHETERIGRVIAEAEEARREPAERRQALAGALEKFCHKHAADAGGRNGFVPPGRRTRRLLFGRVGYRQSQAVVVRSEAAALRALAHWRAGQGFLRLRTELDREALRHFLLRETDSSRVRNRLRRAGIELERREVWFYEVDRARLQRWA